MQRIRLLFSLFCFVLLYVQCNQTHHTMINTKVSGMFSGVTLENTFFDSTKIHGTVHVVNFWAPNCSLCLEELPILNEFAKNNEHINLIFVAVRATHSHAKKIIDQLNIKGTVVLDKENKISSAFSVHAVPMTFVLDKQGVIRKKFLGIFNNAELQQSIKDALQF